ncbi:MAG: hypothetical protein ACHRHE_15640 [Tepidisphaerales bacterium]
MRAKGVKLHDTSGITGLNREQVLTRIRRILDETTGHTGGSRAARYLGAAAGAVITSGVGGLLPGIPTDLQEPAMRHGAELADRLTSQTGHIVAKVLEHPAFKRLVKRIVLRKEANIRKALGGEDADDLKNIVAGVMADTRLDPHVTCSDAGLSAVACGAYRHLCDRICALRDAAR